MTTYAMKWVYMTALCLWGFASFLFLAGDEDPYNPMPMGKFFLIKGVALLSFLAYCYVVRLMHRRGLLPDVPEED